MPKLPIGDDRRCEETAIKVLKNHTFFDILQTDEGFLSLQSYLHSFQRLYLDQVTFENILSNILYEYDEFEAIEIFDLLETKGDGCITIKEFYIFILLQAAVESNQTLLWQYIHGQLIFSVISGSQEFINLNRLESVLKVIGYDYIEIQEKLDEFSLTENSNIDFDLFNIILFSIFKEINSATIDFELTDEEAKLAEVEQNNHFGDNKYDLGFSGQNLASPTPVQEDVIEFVDPFNQVNMDENNSGSPRNSNINKEITNIPLNQIDEPVDEYNSNRYSTK